VQTKAIISDAMFQLLRHVPFDDITVQQILNESHVSRSTFYRYFKDKYELMNWCYKSYVDGLLTQVHKGNWQDYLKLIYEFLDENHAYFMNASKVEGKNSFFDFLYDYSYIFYEDIYLKNERKKALSTEERITLEYACMGAIYIVKRWLETGRKESKPFMAKITFNLLPEMYRQYL